MATLESKHTLLCIGSALVDSIIKGFNSTPTSAAGYTAVSGSLNVGGEAVNEAVIASRLGIDTSIMCHIGNDSAGRIILDTLSEAGINTDPVVFSMCEPTPITTMFVNDDGTRKSITNLAHKYNFHPEQYLDGNRFYDAISIGSLFRAPFDSPDVVYSVMKAASHSSKYVLADTKLPNFKIMNLSDIAEALHFIDYIFPNEDEAKYYTGKNKPDEMADVFLSYGIKNVVIKLGSNGCYYKNNDQEKRINAYNIDAIDATGAGDSFISGFISEKMQGSSDLEALEFANACGAICSTAVGATTALKTRAQVVAFMKEKTLAALI